MKLLFLYTELAPYFLACVERLVKDHAVEVHIVRWPVNKEAPFALRFPDGVRVYERDRFDDAALMELSESIDADIAFASGWVDKGYLKVCRALCAKGKPTVMCSDTAWRGDARQMAATVAARFWLKKTFSHAWVTGEAQARYAHKLGFPAANVRTGFYSADVDRFAPLHERFKPAKTERFPHRLLCVARYIPTKGHQLLCDAFNQLCIAGEAGDWELWIAGTGELHDAVINSASGRNPRIKHLGFVQAEGMTEVMAQCGVFVLPSSFEPWGVVVHEHACAGFPLLLSSAVGARERFLRDGENGHVFVAGDGNTLKNMLRMMILSTDAELLAMGEASAQLGRQWGPGQWAEVVMDLLRSHPALSKGAGRNGKDR
ncbi:MAG: glycosyltransferase family 4 protein [Flavobacteriales bacterium]